MLQSGMQVVGDVFQARNLKAAAKQRIKEAGHQLTEKAATKVKAMIGSGHNKKKKTPTKRFIPRKMKKV